MRFANLNGALDEELELDAEFAALLHAKVIEGDVVRDRRTTDGASPAESGQR